MSGKEFRGPARRCLSVKHFQQCEKKGGFTHGQEKSRKHIARPMRAKVNPGPGNGRGDYKIEPTPAPEKECQDQGDGRVVRDMSGRKRRTGPILIPFSRITNCDWLEESKELWTGLRHLDHTDAFNLLRPASIDRLFQARRHTAVYQKSDPDTENQSAALEPAKNQRKQREQTNERLPNIDIADRRHEQVERGMRPLFVDEMKE